MLTAAWIRRWLRWSLYLGAGVVALLLLAVLAVETPPGKFVLAKAISRVVTRNTSLRLEITGISGLLPGHVRIASIEVDDPRGDFVSLHDLDLRLSPARLLRGRIHIDRLEIGRMDLWRRPIPRQKWRVPRIPALPVWPRIDTLRVHQLVLGEAVAGKEAALSVSGSVLPVEGAVFPEASLEIVGLGAAATRAELSFTYKEGLPQMVLTAHDDTVLPGLLQVASPVVVNLDGSGPRADWKGSMRVDAGEDTLVKGQAEFKEGKDSTLLAGLFIDASKVPFLKAYTFLSGDSLDTRLSVSLDTQGVLDIQSFDIVSDIFKAGVSGKILIEQQSVELKVQAAQQDLSRLPGMDSGKGALAGTLEAALQGTFTDLDAIVKASANDAPVLHAELHGGIRNPATLKGVFTAYPGRLPVMNMPLGADDAVSAAFDLAYEETAGTAVVNRLDVDAVGAHVNMQGNITPHLPALKFKAHLDSPDLAAVAAMLGQNVTGAAQADVEAESSDAGLAVVLNVEGTGLNTAFAQAARLTVAAKGQCRDWAQLPPAGMTAELTSKAEGLVLPGRPPADWEISAQGEVDASGELKAHSIVLTDGNLRIGGECAYNLNTHALGVSLGATAETLAGLLPGSESMPDGKLQATVTANGALEPLAVKVGLNGSLAALKGLPEPLAALAGAEVRLALDCALAADGINVPAVTLAGAAFSASGAASYDRKNGVVSSNASVKLPDLKAVGASFGLPCSGTASIEAKLQGPLDALNAKAEVLATDIVMGPLSADRVKANLEGAGLLGAVPEVTLDAVAETQGETLEADAVARIKDGRVDISPVEIQSGANRISGRIVYTLESRAADADLDADFRDLAVVGRFAGVPLEGSADADLSIEGGVVEGAARGRSIVYSGLRFDTLSAKVLMQREAQRYTGTARMEAAGMGAGPATLKSVEVSVEGGLKEAKLAVRASGSLNAGSKGPQALSLKSQGTVYPRERRMILEETQGALGAYDFGLEEPAEFELTGDGFALAPANLRFGTGNLLLEGRQDAHELSARLRAESFPLAAAGMFSQTSFSGALNGEVLLSGSAAAPIMNASFSVEGARLQGEAAEDLAPLTAKGEAALSAEGLSASVTADMEEILHLNTQVRMPARLQIRPWILELPLESGLSGKTEFDVQFHNLPAALGFEEHALDGKAVGAFTFGGSVSSPELRGEAVVQGARYENSRTGTLLEDLTVRIVAEGASLKLAECTAVTGEQGSMTATGEMQLLYDAQFPFSGTAIFNDARFANLEYLNGRMNGSIRAEGTREDMLVKGEIKVSPVEVSVPDQLPVKEPPVLEVTEVKDGRVVSKEPERASGFARQVRLDIDCVVPGKAYARAPILDSEWGGNLHVGGTLASMKIDGRINVLRGHLDFLNRRFALRDSALLFLDGSPKRPYLDMRAVVDTPKLSAWLSLKGELDEVKMELSSDPVLPQDEILAQILFGQNLSRLSPVQAIQLARVAAMFNQRLSGMPLFSGNIKLPGIDRINLRTGEKADETAVGVGKYLTDSVYVEVEQGTTTSSGKVSVEVEVTPRISVKGDADAKERSGVGLFWKKDY